MSLSSNDNNQQVHSQYYNLKQNYTPFCRNSSNTHKKLISIIETLQKLPLIYFAKILHAFNEVKPPDYLDH